MFFALFQQQPVAIDANVHLLQLVQVYRFACLDDDFGGCEHTAILYFISIM